MALTARHDTTRHTARSAFLTFVSCVSCRVAQFFQVPRIREKISVLLFTEEAKEKLRDCQEVPYLYPPPTGPPHRVQSTFGSDPDTRHDHP